jgi:hypothetical protein
VRVCVCARRRRRRRRRTDGWVIVDHKLVLEKLDGQARLAHATAADDHLPHHAPCQSATSTRTARTPPRRAAPRRAVRSEYWHRPRLATPPLWVACERAMHDRSAALLSRKCVHVAMPRRRPTPPCFSGVLTPAVHLDGMQTAARVGCGLAPRGHRRCGWVRRQAPSIPGCQQHRPANVPMNAIFVVDEAYLNVHYSDRAGNSGDYRPNRSGFSCLLFFAWRARVACL